MESQTETDVGMKLANSLLKLGEAMEEFSVTMKECQKNGWSMEDIRDSILTKLPEENREVFSMQWPYLSMVLASF